MVIVLFICFGFSSSSINFVQSGVTSLVCIGLFCITSYFESAYSGSKSASGSSYSFPLELLYPPLDEPYFPLELPPLELL